MLGVHGPKGQRLAARYADIWSCYAEEKSDMSELGPRLATLEAACAEVGRDPATHRPVGRGPGQPARIRSRIRPASRSRARRSRSPTPSGPFRDGGFTQVELLPTPTSVEAVEALAPVLELLRADEG